MNDCLGEHGKYPKYCPKCLIKNKCEALKKVTDRFNSK